VLGNETFAQQIELVLGRKVTAGKAESREKMRINCVTPPIFK
jgi:hypothetical protein